MRAENKAKIFLRFWPKVQNRKIDCCWIWIGAKCSSGYGNFRMGGKYGKIVAAHRLAWELWIGPVPSGLQVLHNCDTRSCVNPCHLFLGTNKDNVLDRVAKGRSARLSGEANGRAILTEAKVKKLRAMEGQHSHSQLAAKFGISRRGVQRILYRKLWNHI